jgi:hypothetical protein
MKPYLKLFVTGSSVEELISDLSKVNKDLIVMLEKEGGTAVGIVFDRVQKVIARDGKEAEVAICKLVTNEWLDNWAKNKKDKGEKQ